MNVEKIRQFCLALPHTTEDIKWGNDLVFSIGGKMYAVVDLTPASGHRLSFKCTPEMFAELIERPGIIPAPYAARYHWVSIQSAAALARPEIEGLVRQSYQMVLAKLPKKVQQQLQPTGAR